VGGGGGLEGRRAAWRLREAAEVVRVVSGGVRGGVGRGLLRRRRRRRELRRRARQRGPHPRPRGQQRRVVDQRSLHRPHGGERRAEERQQRRVVARPHGREVEARLLLRQRGGGPRGGRAVGEGLLVEEGVVEVRAGLVMALLLLPGGVLLRRGRDLEGRRRQSRRRRRGLRRLVLFRPRLRRMLLRPPSVLAARAPVSSPSASYFIPALPGRARGQRRQRLGRRDVVDLVGEVAPRCGPSDRAGSGVVGARRLLGGVVRAEPSKNNGVFLFRSFGVVVRARSWAGERWAKGRRKRKVQQRRERRPMFLFCRGGRQRTARFAWSHAFFFSPSCRLFFCVSI